MIIFNVIEILAKAVKNRKDGMMQSMGLQRAGHNWVTFTFLYFSVLRFNLKQRFAALKKKREREKEKEESLETHLSGSFWEENQQLSLWVLGTGQ